MDRQVAKIEAQLRIELQVETPFPMTPFPTFPILEEMEAESQAAGAGDA